MKRLNRSIGRHSRRRTRIRVEFLEARQMLAGDFLNALDIDVAEGEAGESIPDFSLIDVNPTSATFNQSVSPADFSGRVTGWYFGHST